MEQRYQCHKHKEVHAEKMTRGDYNIYRGWTIPENENPLDEGYLVIYGKGTDKHHESWSPKDVFDAGYTRIGLSPDDQMEKEINAKGLNYPRIRKEYIDHLAEQIQFDCHLVEGTTTTVVTAFVPMGPIKFTLASEIMACIDPRNFDKDLGEKYGKEKALKVAVNKLWELEGYAMAKKMYCPSFLAGAA